MKNKILSIQSKLVYGYVGSNVAELAIQLHGFDVISYPTVYLSTHTGHQPVFGTVIAKTLFDDLIKGINNLDLLPTTAAIISGYMGSADIIRSAASYIRQIKTTYPDKMYICDPVMGDIDRGGLYVTEEIANTLITELLPLCDILTPNHFELEYILGHKIDKIDDILTYVPKHPLLSTKTVVATSCNLKDVDDNQLETIIIANNTVTRVASKKIPIATTGTGDLFTAMLVSQIALGKDIATAVDIACTTLSNVLNYIVQKDYKEMNAESLLKYIRL